MVSHHIWPRRHGGAPVDMLVDAVHVVTVFAAVTCNTVGRAAPAGVPLPGEAPTGKPVRQDVIAGEIKQRD